MGDVPVRQCDLDWQVKPPGTVKKAHTATFVGRIPGRVEIHVIEAILLEESGQYGERFEGDGMYTGPGFNGDETDYTYVFFHIRIDKMGKSKVKFRMTWRKGRDLFGVVDTLEVTVADSYCSQFYTSEESELLSQLFHWD
ncbi:hypothetical protein GGR55DRAFT_695065 [Xylaria sp. FL0064]|nr:hypothetical protein GGR55DRAFT_695065 [Xylaria sp. FL0064]